MDCKSSDSKIKIIIVFFIHCFMPLTYQKTEGCLDFYFSTTRSPMRSSCRKTETNWWQLYCLLNLFCNKPSLRSKCLLFKFLSLMHSYLFLLYGMKISRPATEAPAPRQSKPLPNTVRGGTILNHCEMSMYFHVTMWKTFVPHADDNRIGPCRVQQQRGSRDHQYQ